MPGITKIERSELIRLAREGGLVDEAFAIFMRDLHPEAPTSVKALMRSCFFAGAAEIYALTLAEFEHQDDEELVAALTEYQARQLAIILGAKASNRAPHA